MFHLDEAPAFNSASLLDWSALLSWFQHNHGSLDESSVGIITFPDFGNGTVALQDIPEGYTLFTIPRSITLSTRTCTLPSLLGTDAWSRHGLGKGWAGLILCMMWEEARGPLSPWSTYLGSLPNTFDTPMFWSDEDLEELKGTGVLEKIGKVDAERDYTEKVVPVLNSHPDIFPLNQISKFYTLERYHVMGSRILSRSFHVERWEEENPETEEEHGDAVEEHARIENVNEDADASMDVDQRHSVGEDENSHEYAEAAEDDDEDEEIEDPSDVAMVPMADMLNARYGCENAKLFYEESNLRMVSTKPIKAGEQIWNTYGNPPNADLLRRYGHVDLVPCPLPGGGHRFGNPADVVEVRADAIVESVVGRDVSAESMKERIDWWLDEGGDDSFVLETDLSVPDAFISLVRLTLQNDTEWRKTQEKSKLPKPKLDEGLAVDVVIDVLERRLREYPTSLEVDEQLLSNEGSPALSLNNKHAVVVRIGEKRILHGALQKLRGLRKSIGGGDVHEQGKRGTKRKGVDGGRDGPEKKSKQSRR